MADYGKVTSAMAQLQNSPYSPAAIPEGDRLPDYGTLFGTTHFNQKIAPRVPQGAPRPLSPGEYVQNPDGGWSSEISLTVPHPTQAGKWTNIPSVWVINGVPRRLNQDQAIQAARQSQLQWPTFDSAQVADKAAGDRETQWQSVVRDQAASVPPLWNQR